jgi:hypothetical protein
MARTEITLEPEIHLRARQRARDLGVSLAEYVRNLIRTDLALAPRASIDVSCLFNLGSSGGSDISKHKDSLVAEAFHAARKQSRRRRASNS